MPVFPLFYLGPIAYYARLLRYPEVQFEVHEHLPKQTFRTRCRIEVPNGTALLTIPVKKTAPKIPFGEVLISYREPWQKDHWRALCTTYQSSPFFAYYDYLFEPFYHQEYERLSDFSAGLHQVILQCLQTEQAFAFTKSFAPLTSGDYRTAFQAKEGTHMNLELPTYRQVFAWEQDRFEANLSIVDLLFNLGPEALDYLHRLR